MNPAVAAAADAFGFAGRILPVRVQGQRLWLVVDIDDYEHGRRALQGAGGITDRALLNGLWELPLGLPIDGAHVAPWALNRIRESSLGVANFAGRTITRVARPPTIIRGAIACGSDLAAGLRAVGALSAIAAMGVVVSGQLSDTDALLLDAHLFGIGVVTVSRGRSDCLGRPDRVITEPGPYAWWVSELAYEAFLGAVSSGAPKH